jgi:hypothetical protein
MPLTFEQVQRFMKAADKAASAKSSTLRDRREVVRRLQREIRLGERREAFMKDPDAFARDFVASNPDQLKPKTKRRGVRGRTIPFQTKVWDHTRRYIDEHLAIQGLQVKNLKGLKRSLGARLKKDLAAPRVTEAAVEKDGLENYRKRVEKFMEATLDLYTKPIVPAVEEAVEITPAGAQKAIVGEQLPEPAAATGTFGEEAPLVELVEKPRTVRSEVARKQQYTGIRLPGVKPDDLDPMRAASKAYEFIGAKRRPGASPFYDRKGLTKFPSPPKETINKDPQLAGYSTGYSDSQFTVFKSPSKVIIAYAGTDELRDWLTNAKMAVSREAFNQDAQVVKAMADTAIVGKGIRAEEREGGMDPREIIFTGHSLGAMLALRAYELFDKDNSRVVGWSVPFLAVAGLGQDFIDGELRRAYVEPGDIASDRIITTGSSYNQPKAFILDEGFEPSLGIAGMMERHSMESTVKREEERRTADPSAGAETEAEVADELARAAEAAEPAAEAAAEPAAAAVGTDGEPAAEPADAEHAAAMEEQFRGIPGVGVRPPAPGAGTFADVVRDELQEMVNRQFHGYNKAYRPYVEEFVSSGRLAEMREQTGGDGHAAFDLLVRNFGSELPVEPFDHRDLDESQMRVLYTELAAGVDWYLRNPERVPARAINKLAVLLETKLFPAPPGTAPEAMSDDQLLAQMATRGAVVKIDPTTDRGRALQAVKSMLGGAAGGDAMAEHPSGAATGDAVEAPSKVADEPDPPFDDVVEPEGDGFRLDLTQFPDNASGATATRLAPAVPFEEGYDLSFGDDG